MVKDTNKSFSAMEKRYKDARREEVNSNELCLCSFRSRNQL